MRRLTILCGLLTLCCALLHAEPARRTIAQESPTATPSAIDPAVVVPLYGKFEARLSVIETVANPYDPAQIAINVLFTAPGGAQVSVAAFYMQPYAQTCTAGCTAEVLEARGEAGWYVRFTPTEVGKWNYAAQVILPGSTATTTAPQSGQFEVVKSGNSGFIRVGSNPRYFGYDDGSSYFPVGSNLGWSWDGYGGTLAYLSWLERLHSVGANYGRLYIDIPWFIGLDWRGTVGNYQSAQQDGWRLDAILDTAERYGIALQIVLVWHQGYLTYGGAPVNIPTTPARPNTDVDWNSNPMSVLRGGPLPNAVSFFTTPAGRELLRRRLRYIMARWGYSPAIFAWELIDQLDRVVDTDAGTAWLRDMTGYLREIDPNAHLITAGVRDQGRQVLLDSADLDFRQTRYYQRRPIESAADQVAGALNAISPLSISPAHPVLLSEFSLGPWFEPAADDPSGVHVVETMWATALSGAGGAGSSWWWDTYLFPANVVQNFGGLATFTKGIDWANGDIQPVGTQLTSNFPWTYAPTVITGFGGTYGENAAPDVVYRVTPDGIFPPISTQSSFLYGVNFNAALGHPHRYIITPPTDTTLAITVRRVSDQASARLVVIIDGVTVSDTELAARSAAVTVNVPISAGEHRVVIDNIGADFLQLDNIQIMDYQVPLRAVAVADRTQGVFLAWVQHRQYTWETVAFNRVLQPITASLQVDKMPAGLYSIELWDPITGSVVGEEQIQVFNSPTGTLSIDLFPLSSTVAVRAVRIAAPADLPTLTPAPSETPRYIPSATLTPEPSPTFTGTVVG